MFRVPANLLFTAIISSQVIILAFGYGFLGAVLYYGYLAPPDRVGNLWKHYPQKLTMVVTLIATALSVTTAILFTISMKKALKHRMSDPMSLVQLSAGVALSKGSYILRPEYLRLTTLTLFVFGILRLLTAGWTTLLTPTYFLWPIQMQGCELDITGTAFATLLSGEFQMQGLVDTFCPFLLKRMTQVQDNAFEVLDIGAMLSGVSAAGYTYGLPGTFNFNGAKYNVSTQGIVPVIEDYSGSDGVPDANSTRLGFSGGNVTVNTRQIPGEHTSVTIPQGFSRNYSMWQQGLTANVSCRPIDASQTQYLWNTDNSSVIYANAAASNKSIAGLRLWNITANCGAGTPTSQEYVTMVDCKWKCEPVRERFSSFSSILSQGFYKYGFLNASVCEVTPLLTTVRAKYSYDLISSEVNSSTPFRPENAPLLSFVAGVAKFQSMNSQGLLSSVIGDTLYSIYSSTTNTSIDENLRNQTQIYQELEEYWRGVVEFSATFLRSGFMAVGSFPGNTIPDDLVSPVNGTIILQARKENSGHRTTFDPSNTLHLIMASAAGNLTLKDFNENGIIDNEGVRVRLEESKDDYGVKKMFVIADPSDLVASQENLV
ncbi:uncharacterized protein BJ212DRAFT_1303175 [Suillus subaureus]|uniref:Uncharacterized protein n=1 Tax=Suillus subaureus TaxID=48587 RepID=A0A9P7E0J0_9AGAM|nr:uncharacterized protein BJ212DRAFT_1303175 [Suillus subaureus]KAG1807976.1 hypothetical protein BJ212DRAFT_1303175 [Suillus subaureus]